MKTVLTLELADRLAVTARDLVDGAQAWRALVASLGDKEAERRAIESLSGAYSVASNCLESAATITRRVLVVGERDSG